MIKEGFIIVHKFWHDKPEEYLTECGNLTDDPLKAWVFENAQAAQVNLNENETVKYISIEWSIEDA